MDSETAKRIAELALKISELPKGSISRKVINGKAYFYHQWRENGKLNSEYLNGAQMIELNSQIELRKKLKEEMNDLKWRGFSHELTELDLPYLLMHLNSPVVSLSFEERTGVISEVGRVENASLLPIGTMTSYGAVDPNKLKDWWLNRSIPASRSGIRNVLEELNISSTTALLKKSYGLSLSDGYWVKEKDNALSWEQVNFFSNPFSDDLGQLLFSGVKKTDMQYSSPDSSSGGNLKKRWKIINGERVLIKGGSVPFRQEPFNEAIASALCDTLGIPHVEYQLIFISGQPYSVCPDFASEAVEFIPAHDILLQYPRRKNESTLSQLLRACDALGIPNVRPAISEMIILDYLIANEDRHTNNFGFLRNSETLEWLGMAPLFDNGSSFGFDKLTADIAAYKDIACEPFKNRHQEQLELAFPCPQFNAQALDSLPALAESFFKENGGKFVDSARAEAISSALAIRVRDLKRRLLG